MTNSIVKKLALKISITAATAYLAVSPAFAADVIGKFPSLLGSDGARAVDTDIVWLGAERDKEANSEQVDADSDDGVVPKFNSCSASKVNFIVHLKKPGKTEGVAYLNLWADWDKDGDWLGSDKCASEWAVQNYEIDLSKQSEEMMIYAPEFVAGENVQDIWYRAAISYNEKLIRSDGGGEFSAGEVEDYGPVPITLLSENATGRPRPPSKVRGLICYPRPLFTEHGGAITFTVGTMPGWEVPVSTGFGADNAGLNAGGTNITLPSGKITKQPKNPNQFGDPNNPFVFVSTSVHDVGLLETIPVVIEATYADNTTAEVTCTILVWHPEPEEIGVVPIPIPVPAPDEDLGHNIIFTFIQSLGAKPKPPTPPFVPPVEPPDHNYVLTLYENGKDVIKSGAGKIKDLVTGGGKQGNVIAPVPAPITQTPPSGGFVGKPTHSEKDSGLEELAGDKIAEVSPPPAVPDTQTLNVFQRVIAWIWPQPAEDLGEGLGGKAQEGAKPPAGNDNIKGPDNNDNIEGPGYVYTPPGGDGLPPVPPPPPVFTPPSGIRPVPVPGEQVQTPNFFQRIWNNIIPPTVYEGGVFFPPVPPGAGEPGNDVISIVPPGVTLTPPSSDGLPPVPPPDNNDNIEGPGYVYTPPSSSGVTLDFPWKIVNSLISPVEELQKAISLAPLPYPEHYTNVSKLRNYILTPGGVSSDQQDGSEVEVGLDRKQIVIDLPVPPRVVSLPLPVQTVFSPFNFLSNRLIDLSNQLKNLVSSVLPTPTYPRCIVKLLEDADQNNRFKYEAECTKYNNCSFEIRSLTNIGNLVSRKTFDLPTSGPLINTDVVPAAAAISNLNITCDGNSFTAIAHNPKAGGQNPSGNTPPNSPTINTSSLAGGTDDVAYSQTVRATGGSTPYTWSVSSGSLPTGLSLAASTGVISGTPTTAETANFTILVTDAFSKTDTKAYSVTIAAGSTPLSLSAPTIAILAANACLSDCSSINSAAYALGAGGTAPYVYSLSALNACAQANNLTVNAGTGAYTTANVSSCSMGVTITVTDANLDTASLVVPAVWQHIQL